MRSRRKGVANKIVSLPEITMEWLRQDMLDDPRAVDLITAGKLDSSATKAQIIAVLNNHSPGGMLAT